MEKSDKSFGVKNYLAAGQRHVKRPHILPSTASPAANDCTYRARQRDRAVVLGNGIPESQQETQVSSQKQPGSFDRVRLVLWI